MENIKPASLFLDFRIWGLASECSRYGSDRFIIQFNIDWWWLFTDNRMGYMQ